VLVVLVCVCVWVLRACGCRKCGVVLVCACVCVQEGVWVCGSADRPWVLIARMDVHAAVFARVGVCVCVSRCAIGAAGLAFHLPPLRHGHQSEAAAPGRFCKLGMDVATTTSVPFCMVTVSSRRAKRESVKRHATHVRRAYFAPHSQHTFSFQTPPLYMHCNPHAAFSTPANLALQRQFTTDLCPCTIVLQHPSPGSHVNATS
jgi:hypothetical protein